MKENKLPYISEKWKVFVIVSFVIACLYTFPSLMLFKEIARLTNTSINFGMGSGKAAYLFVNAFVVSIFLFFFNDNWKRKSLLGFNRIFLKKFISFIVILFILIVVTFFSVAISVTILELEIKKGFFVMNFYRNFMILAVVMLTDYALDLFETKKNQEVKILNLQNEKIESELAFLKSQINPHYLFNSLSSLTTVIRENPKEAITFVNHFSDTFRYILQNTKESLIPVKEELKFLESYMYMMEKRFEGKFSIQISDEVEKLNLKIPQFSLQVLVENAFKHNQLSIKEPLIISINFKNDNIIVSNNLLKKKEKNEGYGIGLSNLSKRYIILADKDIEINKTESQFEVRIPVI